MSAAMHLIVGAGQAGAWAAAAMREAGFEGRIVLAGAEQWRPYERPPLSKAMLTEAEEPPPLWFHKAEKYAAARIDLMLGARAVGIDAKAGRVAFAGGRTVAFDRLLLATGGRSRALRVPGGERAHLLRTLEDARAIRARLAHARRVVCIGAGVIGLEIASSARARGTEVTVLEAAPVPMGRCVSPEGAAFVSGLHRRAGIDLRFNMAVAAIEPGPDGTERVIGADGEVFEADLVVAGIGMERELTLAADAGLALDGGVVVDEHGQTSVPGIYAAGDIAAFPHPLFGGRRMRLESWRHAQNHGIAAGRAMAGRPAPYDDVPWFWTDQLGVNLQVSGLPAEAARTIVRAETDAGLVAVHLGADGTVVGVTAANAPQDARAGMALVQRHARPDEGRLADPSVPLRQLLAS